MSPTPTATNAAGSASPQEQPAPQAIARKYIFADDPLSGTYKMSASAQPVTKQFDDIFHAKFMKVIAEWNSTANRPDLTQVDRKEIIQNSYQETDEIYFGRRQLSDRERKLRALTKLFYKVLSEEPWSESWIRAPDVERKLSRFELHKDSEAEAAMFAIFTPREAVKRAREALVEQEKLTRKLSAQGLRAARIDRGPWDDIEIIYVPGTVSAAATSRLNRDATYPISVSSVANTLHNHICREMVRPYAMAEEFLDCTNTQQLTKLHDFATDVCDYCPHLLDNDNVSLLVVLLILSRSDVCKLWDERGIRIEGLTISHRKAECMKNKLGWSNSELRKPFDSFANEFQTRVKNAVNPDARGQRGPKKGRPASTTSQPPPMFGPNGIIPYGQPYVELEPPNGHRGPLYCVPIESDSQPIEPDPFAPKSKGKKLLAYMDAVGDPLLRGPENPDPPIDSVQSSDKPGESSDKLGLPTDSNQLSAEDVRTNQSRKEINKVRAARGLSPLPFITKSNPRTPPKATKSAGSARGSPAKGSPAKGSPAKDNTFRPLSQKVTKPGRSPASYQLHRKPVDWRVEQTNKKLTKAALEMMGLSPKPAQDSAAKSVQESAPELVQGPAAERSSSARSSSPAQPSSRLEENASEAMDLS